MDDADLVRGAQHVEQLRGHGDRRPRGQAPLGLGEANGLQILPLEEVHHEKHRDVVHVVVEDANHPAVLDAVGHVALAEEPLARRSMGGELRVQNLDRTAEAVAVGARVDRRHASDADERIEPPLAAKRAADALSRHALDHVRRRLVHARASLSRDNERAGGRARRRVRRRGAATGSKT